MVHIGAIIKEEVERQRLTQKEFGALIHKNEKTVPSIYLRATMTIDLLVIISVALKKDFLKFFYEKEPMISLRTDEASRLKAELQKAIEQKEQLQKELSVNRNLVEAQKDTISLAKELKDVYKMKL